MTSATYRQSSVADPDVLEADPENVWLARGPAYRMPAEMIRDNALAASGLLVREIGGPSVYPYQPPGLWEELATRNATSYVQGHGDDLYRRSLYTIWKRTSPPPSMISFDAAERLYTRERGHAGIVAVPGVGIGERTSRPRRRTPVDEFDVRRAVRAFQVNGP